MSDRTCQFCTCQLVVWRAWAPCRSMHLQNTTVDGWHQFKSSVHIALLSIREVRTCLKLVTLSLPRGYLKPVTALIRHYCHVQGSSQTSFHTCHAQARLRNLTGWRIISEHLLQWKLELNAKGRMVTWTLKMTPWCTRINKCPWIHVILITNILINIYSTVGYYKQTVI